MPGCVLCGTVCVLCAVLLCVCCVHAVCVLCVCTVCVLCVCAVCVLCVYCVCTVCVLCVYCVCTVCVLCVCCVCTVCVLRGPLAPVSKRWGDAGDLSPGFPQAWRAVESISQATALSGGSPCLGTLMFFEHANGSLVRPVFSVQSPGWEKQQLQPAAGGLLLQLLLQQQRNSTTAAAQQQLQHAAQQQIACAVTCATVACECSAAQTQLVLCPSPGTRYRHVHPLTPMLQLENLLKCPHI